MKECRGTVCNIQRYSIHDGPGIRSVVFLKGCPLRCAWCSNPETQNARPEQMNGEWTGREMSTEEVMCVVRRDSPFYRRSGGGLTLSGGEPLMQPQFSLSIVRKCRQEGIHCAIETAGSREDGAARAVLQVSDLVLFDLKHMNSEKHRQYTGMGNEVILRNFTWAVQSGLPVAARMPVIPGFNFSEQDIADVAVFCRQNGLAELTLLPYHRLGLGKYRALDREYLMGALPALDRDILRSVAECVSRKTGVTLRV